MALVVYGTLVQRTTAAIDRNPGSLIFLVVVVDAHIEFKVVVPGSSDTPIDDNNVIVVLDVDAVADAAVGDVVVVAVDVVVVAVEVVVVAVAVDVIVVAVNVSRVAETTRSHIM